MSAKGHKRTFNRLASESAGSHNRKCQNCGKRYKNGITGSATIPNSTQAKMRMATRALDGMGCMSIRATREIALKPRNKELSLEYSTHNDQGLSIHP